MACFCQIQMEETANLLISCISKCHETLSLHAMSNAQQAPIHAQIDTQKTVPQSQMGIQLRSLPPTAKD